MAVGGAAGAHVGTLHNNPSLLGENARIFVPKPRSSNDAARERIPNAIVGPEIGPGLRDGAPERQD